MAFSTASAACSGNAPAFPESGISGPDLRPGGVFREELENVQQFEYPAKLLCSGAEQLHGRMTTRLSDPHLHARLIHRAVLGQVVFDHEEVTRTFPEGTGKIGLVAIYEVRDGKIATAL